MAFGALWLLVALYLIVAGTIDWLSPHAWSRTLIWPCLGLLALAGGIGLLTGRAYARGVLAFVSGLAFLAGLYFLAFPAFFTVLWASSRASGLDLQSILFWFLFVSLEAFFAWSLFFVVKLWPDYELPKGVAG